MGDIAARLAPIAEKGLMLGQGMFRGIEADRFARLIVIDGKTITANHPAFVFGHLSRYPATIGGMLGLDAAGVATPDSWEGLLGRGVECRDDPDGSIYPPMAEIVDAFVRGYSWAMETLPSVSDEAMLTTIPEDSPYHGFMPTVGAGAAFIFTSHVMFHLGQVSTWRRCEGLESVMG